MHSPEVQILLSTFNGELYLKDQLESILNQTFKNWELLIHDDGSSDSTVQIIEEYCFKFNQRIKRIEQPISGNSSLNFIKMLDKVQAPYLMFCDQDDIWLEDKIELSISEIKELQLSCPIALFFTDMEVVDSDLKVLSESFFKKQKIDPKWVEKANYSFVQSIAAGCTMIFTKELIKNLHPIDPSLFQHDQWLLMHAANYGKVAFSERKTVLYRQHITNVFGSHAVNSRYFLKKLGSISALFKRWRYIQKSFGKKVSIIKMLSLKIRVSLKRLV